MKKILILSSLFLIYGCGGGSNTSTTLSGTVADGYIENATVCFDSNDNLTCDAGEPTTTTAADGTYSVTATGSVEGLAVIAIVGTDAKDSDDGGLTLAEAGKEGFNFLAPAENPAVVSPLSTLIQFEIVSNPNYSLEVAQNAVKQTLGIDNDSVNLLEYDFVEAASGGDSFATNIKEVTEVLSSALGDVTKNMNDDSAIASLKSGSDDGMKAFQSGILDMIKDTVIPATVAGGAVNGTVDDLKAQLKGAFRPSACSGGSDCNTTGSLVSGFQTAVTAKKKAVKVAATAGAQSVSNAEAIIRNGVIIGWEEDGMAWNDSGTKTALDGETLVVQYIKMAAEGEYSTTKLLVETATDTYTWEDSAYSTNNDWSMDPKTGIWAKGELPGDDGSDEPVFSGGCMSFTTPTNYTENICFKERDLSGKSIASVLCPEGTQTNGSDEFCDNLNGNTSTFQDGSKGLDVSFNFNFDLYRQNIDACLEADEEESSSCWHGYSGTNSKPALTLEDFIAHHAIGSNHAYIGEKCNTAFTFNSTDKKIIFKKNTGTCSSSSVSSISSSDTDLETLDYVIKEVGTAKTKVLVSGVPDIYRQGNPNEGVSLAIGAKLTWSPVPTNLAGPKKTNTSNTTGIVIMGGNLIPQGSSRKYSFDTGDAKIGTHQFLDSIIPTQNWEAYPYPTSVNSN